MPKCSHTGQKVDTHLTLAILSSCEALCMTERNITGSLMTGVPDFHPGLCYPSLSVSDRHAQPLIEEHYGGTAREFILTGLICPGTQRAIYSSGLSHTFQL